MIPAITDLCEVSYILKYYTHTCIQSYSLRVFCYKAVSSSGSQVISYLVTVFSIILLAVELPIAPKSGTAWCNIQVNGSLSVFVTPLLPSLPPSLPSSSLPSLPSFLPLVLPPSLVGADCVLGFGCNYIFSTGISSEGLSLKLHC